MKTEMKWVKSILSMLSLIAALIGVAAAEMSEDEGNAFNQEDEFDKKTLVILNNHLTFTNDWAKATSKTVRINGKKERISYILYWTGAGWHSNCLYTQKWISKSWKWEADIPKKTYKACEYQILNWDKGENYNPDNQMMNSSLLDVRKDGDTTTQLGGFEVDEDHNLHFLMFRGVVKDRSRLFYCVLPFSKGEDPMAGNGPAQCEDFTDQIESNDKKLDMPWKVMANVEEFNSVDHFVRNKYTLKHLKNLLGHDVREKLNRDK